MRLADTRYFVTSANPDRVCAPTLLEMVRHHWQIENCVFFVKDRWWDEDRNWTKRSGLSEWIARLTSIATMILRIFCIPDEPLRAHADYIQWTPRLGLEILGLA